MNPCAAPSEFEQALADQVRQLTCPLISLKDGVLLLPLGGILTGEQSQQLIAETIEDLLQRPASDLLLDLEGVADLDEKLERMLIDLVQKVAQRGTRVTFVAARADLQRKMADKKNELSGIKHQASVVQALDQLNRK